MLGDERRIIDKHVLAEVFRTCHTRETKVDRVETFNAEVALANITNRVPNIYNTNERWVVKKMRL